MGKSVKTGGKIMAAVGNKVAGRVYARYAANQTPYNARAMEALLKSRYGKDAVASSTLLRFNERNVKLAGQRHPVTGVVFDQKGFPVFDEFAVFDMRLSGSLALTVESDIHKVMATKELAAALGSNPALKAKFSEAQITAIMTGKKTIPDYRWHHHQDIGRMQLIPKKVHEETGHVGESLWTRGLDAAE
jgi:hypothetical protein